MPRTKKVAKKAAPTNKGAPKAGSLEHDLADLRHLISEYGQACRADEMKGGGDPLFSHVTELECVLADERIAAQLNMIVREHGSR